MEIKNTNRTKENNTSYNAEIPVKLDLPKADLILVLGILSIGFSFLAGFSGLILAVIALKLSKKAKELFKYAPELYNKNSSDKVKAGVITAWIGIALSVIVLFFTLIWFTIVRVFS